MYLMEDKSIDPDKIVLFGRSLGPAPAGWLASTERVGAVILVAPFLSCLRVIQKVGVTPPFDMFPNVDRIHLVGSHVLVIHGRKDELVPFEHARSSTKKHVMQGNPCGSTRPRTTISRRRTGIAYARTSRCFWPLWPNVRRKDRFVRHPRSITTNQFLWRASAALDRQSGALQRSRCQDGIHMQSTNVKRGYSQKSHAQLSAEVLGTLESEADAFANGNPKCSMRAKQRLRMGQGRPNYESESREQVPSELDDPRSIGKRALRAASRPPSGEVSPELCLCRKRWGGG